jgi:hypothetical protein
MSHASELPLPGTDGQIIACGVCARVLEGYELDGQFLGYQHARHSPALDDHVPVPVRASEIKLAGRCDFCGDDGPRWRLPVEPFTYKVAGITRDGQVIPLDHNAHSSDRWWGACEPCVAYIRAERWRDMAWHAVYRMQQRREIPLTLSARERAIHMDSLLNGVWAQVRAHQAGPPELILPEGP